MCGYNSRSPLEKAWTAATGCQPDLPEFSFCNGRKSTGNKPGAFGEYESLRDLRKYNQQIRQLNKVQGLTEILPVSITKIRKGSGRTESSHMVIYEKRFDNREE